MNENEKPIEVLKEHIKSLNEYQEQSYDKELEPIIKSLYYAIECIQAKEDMRLPSRVFLIDRYTKALEELQELRNENEELRRAIQASFKEGKSIGEGCEINKKLPLMSKLVEDTEKELQALKDRVNEALNRLGAPTTHYCTTTLNEEREKIINDVYKILTGEKR